ncbi:MAG: aminotransferase class V-fold PLP-dependent enzyme [Nitrososphaerales archaeon]
MLSNSTLLEEFPIKNRTAYFNNASYTPMSRSAITAISIALESYSSNGPNDAFYLEFKRGANRAREKLAALLNVKDSQDIVFTESATQSINMIANGFKFSRDDSLVTRGGANEHPSNYLPWKYYSDQKSLNRIDLPVDTLGFPDPSTLDSVLKESKAKLVVLTHVLYNLGTIMPAKEFASVTHERGALFFLDISQSVANIAVDLEQINCDYAAGTAAKWLCGPLGLGFLYCKKEALDHLELLNFGANAATYTPGGEYRLLEGASRLQEGFRNWSFAYGLSAAIDLLVRFGLESSRSENLKNADAIIQSIESSSRKYRFIGSREENERTSIVPIECLESKPLEIVQMLAKQNIVIAEREIGAKKILRISPHFYNDEIEVERLAGAL